MITSRETIMAALFDKLAGVTFSQPVQDQVTWVTMSRRIKLWTDVPPTERPALFITDHEETPAYQAPNLPQKNTMAVQLWVYFASRDAAAVPSTDLNVLLDAIDAALAPGANGAQTLGGIVAHCRVEGTVLKDPGDMDGDGLILVPLRILAT